MNNNMGLGLVLLAMTTLLVSFASYHYQNEIRFVEANTPIQCGHMVFAKTCQLLGAPVTTKDLLKLPSRSVGVSMAELKQELNRKGIMSNLDFDPQLFENDFDELVVCKLANPDHFVLLRSTDQERLELLSENQHLIQIDRDEIESRYSGYCLKIAGEQDPVRVCATSFKQPLPQFETLRKDAGDLKYKEYESKSVQFDFKLRNVGESPLRLLNVESSCSCTSMNYTQDPIAPGEEVNLQVSYKSSLGNTDGEFTQQIFVETNSPDYPMIGLEVAGRFPGRMSCIPKRMRVEINSKFFNSAEPQSQFLMVDHPRYLEPNDLKVVIEGIAPNLVSIHQATLSELNRSRLRIDPYFVPIQPRAGLAVYEIRLKPELLEASSFQNGQLLITDKNEKLGTTYCSISIMRVKKAATTARLNNRPFSKKLSQAN